jgi:hypothetical protein
MALHRYCPVRFAHRYSPGRHRAYFKATKDHKVAANGLEFNFVQDELVRVEESIKVCARSLLLFVSTLTWLLQFSESDAYTLFTEGGLRPIQRWTDSSAQYSLWLLERPPFAFPLLKSPVACNAKGELVAKTQIFSSSPFGVPSPQDWENLWTAWDFITLRMIPTSMLHQKPIDLRHICLFYIGHIPAFLDIHLSRLLKEPHTEPESFKNIFEVQV